MAQSRILEISYYDDKENNMSGFVSELDDLVNKKTGGSRITQIDDDHDSTGNVFYTCWCSWGSIDDLVSEIKQLVSDYNDGNDDIDFSVDFYHYTEGEVVQKERFEK